MKTEPGKETFAMAQLRQVKEFSPKEWCVTSGVIMMLNLGSECVEPCCSARHGKLLWHVIMSADADR